MNGVQAGRGPNPAVVPSLVLLAGGVLVGVGALLGTAHTLDGSVPGSVPSAAWIVLLPAVVALVSSWRQPLLALGLAAGAGLAAVARLLADLGVVTDPNSAIRPELFYEVTLQAQPFSVAAGAWVMIAGDVVMVIAGVLAGRVLAERLGPRTAPIFGSSPAAATETGQGPELLAKAWEAEIPVPAVDLTNESGAVRGDDAPPTARNNALIVAGFVGVLLLLAGTLGLPYDGGYLTGRYLPAELGLAGIGGALATALVATVAVLVAAALPRRLAAALLGGVALVAAVPLLTAVLVRLAGAPVQLSASLPVALVGAVVLAVAGWFGNTTSVVDDYDVPSTSALRRLRWIGATLSVLTAVAAGAAWRLPQLRYNGGADPVLPGGYAISAPLAAPFLLAAVLPVVGAVLWLIPAADGAGRAVVAIGWLPLVFAATQTLYLLGQLVSSASVPNAGFAPPRWTAGPGLWSAVAGLVLGIGAAVVSALAARQARDASTLVAQEESLDRSRTLGVRTATALSVLTVIALALPVYRTAAGPSATLLVGFDVRSWGVLALAAGMITAAFAGGRSLRAVGALGFLLAGAAISVGRLVVPASVRAADGFSLRPGWYVGWAVAVLFVLAAALLAFSTRRIVLIDAGAREDRGGRRSPLTPARRAGSTAGRQAGERAAGARPVGKRPSAGASSSKAKGRAR